MPWYKPVTWFEKSERSDDVEKAVPQLQGSPAPVSAPPPRDNQLALPPQALGTPNVPLFPSSPAPSPQMGTGDGPGGAPLDVAMGSTGLRRVGGFVDEELLTKLAGRRAVRVYREMSDNSAVVGAVLYVIEMLLRQVEWRTEPAGESPRQKYAAQFLDECFEDMAHTWDELIAEVLSMLPHGWSYFETVFKLRCGNSDDPRTKSRFNDGMVGLRKVSIRSQDTLYCWEFDTDGSTLGLWQMDPYSGKGTVFIPIGRALLFRTTSRKNNPEGRSVLRNAYRSWYFGKRIEEIEAIGIERDLTGLPVIELPWQIMDPAATAAQKAVRQSYQTLVQQIRRDEREGILMPSSVDPKGNATGYKLSLLSTGGRRAIDTSAVVTRHEQRIAMTMLAEFIFLGTDNVGSWSLASAKTSLFTMALSGHMENIASTINRYLIPRLMALNGFSPEEYPKVVYGDIEAPPLDEIAAFINQLVGAGVLTPDDSLERKLREMAKLPEMPEKNAQKPVAPAAPDAAGGGKPAAGNTPGAPKPPRPPGPSKPPKPKPPAAAKPQGAPKAPKAPTVGPAAGED